VEFSTFGKKLADRSGIMELMDDLGKVMGGQEKMIMMGGGNPAHIPVVKDIFYKNMQTIMQDRDAFDRMLTNYDTPQGNFDFIDTVVSFFNNKLGWKLKRNNITITNGSQNGFFYLFNMFGGSFDGGGFKKVLLPLSPEYIGYTDQGLVDGLFQAQRPIIEDRESHRFKYHVNFDSLVLDENVGCMCASRPTNPSGNVLTDEEIHKLSALAKQSGIPLLIDNAYGLPFPGIIFREADIHWEDHMILSMSLSKLGLPGTRTGILVANEEVIRAVSSMHAIVALANGNIGQALTRSLFQSGQIQDISKNMIRPFYEQRSLAALSWMDKYFGDRFPWRVHESEGALFLWLNLPGLPITSQELYERLKKRGVLVVPGHYFFAGLEEEWAHKTECLRLNYSMDSKDVEQGIRIIGDELNSIFG
jgi:valine--pyruvate aminotransferase